MFDDVNCFQYSVLVGMNLVEIHKRGEKYCASTYNPYMYMLNMNDIDVPVPVSLIEKFENQNPDISVNVLQALNEKQDIVSIYISMFGNQRKYHVNLLMLTYGNDKFHYTSVQTLSRLISRQSKHNGKKHVCQYCLYPFCKESFLHEHLNVCNGYQHYQQTVALGNTSIYARRRRGKRAIIRRRRRRRQEMVHDDSAAGIGGYRSAKCT